MHRVLSFVIIKLSLAPPGVPLAVGLAALA